jgi:hypothetical protein
MNAALAWIFIRRLSLLAAGRNSRAQESIGNPYITSWRVALECSWECQTCEACSRSQDRHEKRDLRDLTRYRTMLVQERVRVVSRMQKVLEAIVEGHADPETMAQLARGRLRNKLPQLEKALTGLVRDHHRFFISMQLTHIDFLDEHQICEMACSQPPCGTNSGEAIPVKAQEAVFLLSTIPGVDKTTNDVV